MPFTFPPIYSFPPFYTRQPNIQTWETQLEHWRRLVLDYSRYYNIWALSLNGLPFAGNENDQDDDDAEDDEEDIETVHDSLFQNDAIDRSLKNDFILEIYRQMIEKGEADWVNENNHKQGILVYWHSLEEWANILMDWITNTGQEGSVLTLYEIRKGELSQKQEFANMDTHLLTRVLNTLSKEGRARILKDGDNNVVGVKFGQ